MTDAELVTLSQRGDLRAFNELAGRAHGALFRFVRRLLGNSEDARDVCQEALIKAYVNIGRLRDPEKFGAWLHHIALNQCRDWHRAARARPALQSMDAGAEGESRSTAASLASSLAAPSFTADIERAHLLGNVQALLDRLSLEQRTAILLREYQGFTSQEIAEITGVPAATVRTRIFYGLKAIHRMLDEQSSEEARLERARREGGERQ